MQQWKHLLKKEERYKGFTILNNPVSFSKLFKDQNIPCVQVHSNDIVGPEGEQSLLGFCGVFSWVGNTLVSLDHDCYNPKMKVLAYEWGDYEGGKLLDIMVGNDW